MAKNIRSQFIKSLMEEKEQLNQTLEETTRETLKSIVDEAVNHNLRSMLTESEDDYKEEEVDTLGADEPNEDTPETEDEKTENDANENDSEEEQSDDVEDTESDVTDNVDGEEDMWAELENLKSEDGEYDLTGLDIDGAIKVLKVMQPEDGVRVMKLDNGNIKLADEENDTEYVIELGNEDAVDGDDETFEIDIEDKTEESVEECGNQVNEENLGYTDDYQNKTAMTTPDNHEPADEDATYSMDGGVPTGTEKPWAGDSKNKTPYEEPVNEECDVEIEISGDDDEEDVVDESTTVADKNPQAQGVTKTHGPNTSRKAARNGSVAGEKVKSTSEPRYSPEVVESVMVKANKILAENKELRGIAKQIKQQLSEACVINACLGKIIKLVTENTTTRDEKINIVNRFNKVKTIEESKQLYDTIVSELKTTHKINNVNEALSGQLSESRKTNVTETEMYKSQDLYRTLDMMKRLENV